MKERNISTGMKNSGNSVYVLYRKRNNSYWEEGGIEETRQKRQRISRDGTASRDETTGLE